MASHVACLIAMSVRLVTALDVGGIGCVKATTRPRVHGAAGWKLKAMRRNNPASGQAAAKAMRTRVAVSVIRPAILSRRIRRVANSAVASGCDLAMASRTVSSNQ